MSINKLVHEARGLCWHVFYETMSRNDRGQTLWGCRRCHERFLEGDEPNPDYENDMNACMELWKEVGLYDLVNDENPDHPGPIQGPVLWIASLPPEDDYPVREYKDGGYHETPQLAIIHAFLKSKGVVLGEDDG